LIKLIESDLPLLVDDISMSRIVRHLLIGSVLAFHAAVTLCGPCLHALPGTSHGSGTTSNLNRPDDPVQPRPDSADNCLICHFLAQGQLPVELTSVSSTIETTDLVVAAVSNISRPAIHFPSSPRAPPVNSVIWS
jgi:hypothetical protein